MMPPLPTAQILSAETPRTAFNSLAVPLIWDFQEAPSHFKETLRGVVEKLRSGKRPSAGEPSE